MSGQGPEVAMLHGLAGDLSFWFLRFVPPLTGRYRVLTYDLRGHGLSTMPRSGYTTHHMAMDLLRLMDRLGFPRTHLVGHSFGGAVALHAAVLAPHRVQSLALVDARVPALQPLLDRDERAQWQAMRGRMRGSIDHEAPQVTYSYLDELARLEGGRPAELPATGRRAVLRWRQLLETTTALRDVVRPAGLTPELISGVRQPVLASYGELSHCLPTAGRLQELLPQMELHLAPGAGHFHPIVDPARLVELLSLFWEQSAAAAEVAR